MRFGINFDSILAPFQHTFSCFRVPVFSWFFGWCFSRFSGISGPKMDPKSLGRRSRGVRPPPHLARFGADIVPRRFFHWFWIVFWLIFGWFWWFLFFLIDFGTSFGRLSDDLEGFFARYLVLFCNISTSFSQRFRREHADTNTPTVNAPTVTKRGGGIAACRAKDKKLPKSYSKVTFSVKSKVPEQFLFNFFYTWLPRAFSIMNR